MKPNLTARIARAVLGDHNVITMLLGMAALLLAAGFLISTNVPLSHNYSLLTDLANYKFWFFAFFLYGIAKIASTLYRTPFIIKLITSVSGMWLWSYLMLSFVIFDITPIAPTEMMLFITGICEVWALALNIFDSKHTNARRETDNVD